MRLSVSPRDYDYYRNRFPTGRLIVRCNGAVVDLAQEADTDGGYVVRIKLDSRGQIVINAARNDFERETVRGFVTVEWLP